MKSFVTQEQSLPKGPWYLLLGESCVHRQKLDNLPCLQQYFHIFKHKNFRQWDTLEVLEASEGWLTTWKYFHNSQWLPKPRHHMISTLNMVESHFLEEWKQTGAFVAQRVPKTQTSCWQGPVFAAAYSSSRSRRIWCLLTPVERLCALLRKYCWKMRWTSDKEKTMNGSPVFTDIRDTGQLVWEPRKWVTEWYMSLLNVSITRVIVLLYFQFLVCPCPRKSRI